MYIYIKLYINLLIVPTANRTQMPKPPNHTPEYLNTTTPQEKNRPKKAVPSLSTTYALNVCP